MSFSSLLVAGILSYLQFRKAVQNEVYQKLVGIRNASINEIELYMQNVQTDVEVLSEDRTIISAMVEFNSSYQTLKNEIIPPEWLKDIETFYQTKFLPKLSGNVLGEQLFVNYNPATQVGQYLQYHYIVNNSFSLNEKSKLINPRDGSDYSKIHIKYHPKFRKLVEKFGYSDLFLIDFDSGEIIYSVEKETDYATNLDRGAYRRSGLAEVVDLVRDNPEKSFVQIVDFEPYAPYYGSPVAFLAAPIYNGPHLIGIFAVQLPVDQINFILSGNKNWQEKGLGKTGQVYVVGSDLLMRSDSRLLLEDSQKYVKSLRQANVPSQIVSLIEQLKTSILLRSIKTKAAKSAISGVSGIEVIDDYRGIPVISAYAPLSIEGLEWAIIVEINRSEAFKSISVFQIYLSVISVILLLLITWLADLLSHNFVKPIHKLVDAGSQLKESKEIEIDLERQDELGELGKIFNDIGIQIKAQNQLLEEKNQENETLLANILPPSAMAQFQQRNKQIIDSIAKVTILYAKIVGLNNLFPQKSTVEVAEILNKLIAICDHNALEYGLEKQNTIWDNYVTICGLSESHLDQQQRSVNFALKMIQAIEKINQDYQIDLGWRIGIHSGQLTAGVVGNKKFAYKIWGSTVDIVTNLNRKGAKNSIIVTESIKERLSDPSLFVLSETIQIEDTQTIPTWTLISTKKENDKI